MARSRCPEPGVRLSVLGILSRAPSQAVLQQLVGAGGAGSGHQAHGGFMQEHLAVGQAEAVCQPAQAAQVPLEASQLGARCVVGLPRAWLAPACFCHRAVRSDRSRSQVSSWTTWLRLGSQVAPLTLRLLHKWPLALSQWQKELCCPSAFPDSEACMALQVWKTAFTRGLSVTSRAWGTRSTSVK